MELNSGVAFVTGAASGMGRGTARRFAAEGMKVCVVDIDAAGVQAVADEIGGLAVVADVSDAAQVEAAVARCVTELGVPDVAHLNAGIGSAMQITAFDLATYRKQTGVNIDGVVFGAAAVAKAMRERTDGGRGGAIVITSSVGGLQPFAGDPIYALTKFATIGFARSIAPALAPDGITVQVICPGLTDTAFLGAVRDFLVANNVPMITPEQIADVVVHALNAPPETSGTCWVFMDPFATEPFPFEFAELPPDETAARIAAALENVQY
jgi:NAD(P)-dependent dehydrogenase (short-subunit alcohol dehydrogenase family)